MNIKVRDYIDYSDASSPEQGDKFYSKLYKVVEDCISTKEKIEIDFEGICTVTTAFLNNSISKLFTVFGDEKLKDLISFTGLTSNAQIESLRLSISAALALSKIKKES